jgi:DNA-dependent RNA polymerase auxiliary subunit epsilon
MAAVTALGLTKVLAPLGAAAVNFFGQNDQLRDQKRKTKRDLALERGLAREARQTLQDTNYDVSQSLRTFLDKAQQDPVADALRQRQLRREADSVGALRSGGARALLGGLGAVNQQSASAMANIEADSFARQQAARQAFGAAETDIMAKNTEKDLGLAGFDLGRALSRGDDAEKKLFENKAQARKMRRETLSGLIERTPDFMDALGLGGKTLEFFNKNGGMISPGEFSHKTNPIDMVKKGEKVGELTGGEVILNPEQEKKVAAESPYFRALVKKFQADAKKRK